VDGCPLSSEQEQDARGGTYFDLVVNQKTPVEKAMVQAFDMSPTQMEER
jgi:hypothetical protein